MSERFSPGTRVVGGRSTSRGFRGVVVAWDAKRARYLVKPDTDVIKAKRLPNSDPLRFTERELKREGEVTILLKQITIVIGRGLDDLSFVTDLPHGFTDPDLTAPLYLSAKTSPGGGEAYARKHFPETPLEIIDARDGSIRRVPGDA